MAKRTFVVILAIFGHFCKIEKAMQKRDSRFHISGNLAIYKVQLQAVKFKVWKWSTVFKRQMAFINRVSK